MYEENTVLFVVLYTGTAFWQLQVNLLGLGAYLRRREA